MDCADACYFGGKQVGIFEGKYFASSGAGVGGDVVGELLPLSIELIEAADDALFFFGADDSPGLVCFFAFEFVFAEGVG